MFCEDCITGAQNKIGDESVDLVICDPPFGINEATFDKHYSRDETNVIPGYVEAPEDYQKFTLEWMSQAKRVLKPNGSMYVIIGHTNLRHVLNAAAELGLHEINHIIWKFNFGNYTRTKFVTSHYHILFYSKSATADTTFNMTCRYGSQQKNEMGLSLLYADLEDVFYINREYHQGIEKNQNKLPDALLEKLILYSSNEKDWVCDFFLGNFTTAIVAKSLGRNAIGFEKNPAAFCAGMSKYNDIPFGCRLSQLPEVVDDRPSNQWKRLTQQEIEDICRRYGELMLCTSKKEAIKLLSGEFGRGRFGIINILKAHRDLIDPIAKKFEENDIIDWS